MSSLLYSTASIEDVAPLPPGAAYAGHINGPHVTYPAVRERFPDRPVLSITTTASVTAHVLDVNDHDAFPAQAPSWVRRCHADGIMLPIIRAPALQMPITRLRLTSSGLEHRRDFLLWVITFPGAGSSVPDIYDAHRFIDAGRWFISNVADPDVFFSAITEPPPSTA
jgi:hypothetical protein